MHNCAEVVCESATYAATTYKNILLLQTRYCCKILLAERLQRVLLLIASEPLCTPTYQCTPKTHVYTCNASQ